MSLPPGVVLQGIVLGSLTGLSAMGLVLVYRACRIVNFAQATLGSAAAVLATQLFQHRGWNYYAAFAAGIVTAAVVGALADRLVIQRFFWAPRLVLTVATIGLAQILSGIELTLPRLFGGGGPLGGLSGGFRTPLRLVVPPFAVAVLRRPRAGAGRRAGGAWRCSRCSCGAAPSASAIRASSANAERAMLLGIPVRRLSTVVWSMAAVLSALSAMLAAPLVGSGSSFTSGPALLLPALAAAVLARMESLPRRDAGRRRDRRVPAGGVLEHLPGQPRRRRPAHRRPGRAAPPAGQAVPGRRRPRRQLVGGRRDPARPHADSPGCPRSSGAAGSCSWPCWRWPWWCPTRCRRARSRCSAR